MVSPRFMGLVVEDQPSELPCCIWRVQWAGVAVGGAWLITYQFNGIHPFPSCRFVRTRDLRCSSRVAVNDTEFERMSPRVSHRLYLGRSCDGDTTLEREREIICYVHIDVHRCRRNCYCKISIEVDGQEITLPITCGSRKSRHPLTKRFAPKRRSAGCIN